jgi:hypothetical protein
MSIFLFLHFFFLHVILDVLHQWQPNPSFLNLLPFPTSSSLNSLKKITLHGCPKLFHISNGVISLGMLMDLLIMPTALHHHCKGAHLLHYDESNLYSLGDVRSNHPQVPHLRHIGKDDISCSKMQNVQQSLD